MFLERNWYNHHYTGRKIQPLSPFYFIFIKLSDALSVVTFFFACLILGEGVVMNDIYEQADDGNKITTNNKRKQRQMSRSH